jgi:predicted Ser/Thr protein kinase
MNTRELQAAGMDASPDSESLYRFRADSYVLYVVLQPHCTSIPDPFDYGFPPAVRKLLPPTIDSAFNMVHISSSGELAFTTTKLKGVDTIWHPTIIDVTTLPVVRQIKANVFKVKYAGEYAVAKIARFEFEVPYIEAETQSYQVLNGLGLGPKFLAHLSENGRPMGMLIECLDGRRPTKDDFKACSRVLRRLHSQGWAHRDINRDNFVVVGSEAKLLDFEESGPATEQERSAEMEKLYQELIDESGRGAPAHRQDYVEGEYPMGI